MSRPYAAKLQELLQASYNLPNAVCDLGRVELGPAELEEVTRRIYEHDNGKIDAKAHYLLATSGFNAEQVLSEIAKIKLPVSEPRSDKTKSSVPASASASASASATSATSTASAKAAPRLQIHGHTGLNRAAHPSKYSSSIDAIVAQTSREFDEFIDKQLTVDWTARKREVIELLDSSGDNIGGGSRSSTGSGDGSSPKKAPKHRVGAHILGPQSTEPTKVTPLMRAYADIVTALCDHEFVLPDIVDRFAKAAATHAVQGYVLDSWQALRLRDPLKFLERQFWDHINAEINARRQDAKLGGVPSSVSKVKAYVALKYYRHNKWDSRLTLINKTPIWAYLYYLVRSGHFEEALQLVLERKDIFETMGSSFAVYFKAWVDSPTRTLSPHYSEMIHAEYHQLFRPGAPSAQSDPYKQALYKVIGRCDLSKRTVNQVATTTEDWLWFQLRLCQPNSQYTLDDLRAYILDIGPKHLASDPLKYFTVLVVLGLYADALTFLRNHDEVHAVHYGIALIAAQSQELQKKGACDFNSLVGRYTRYFRQAMPSLAVDYLVVIALPGTKDACSAAQQALQELVLETRRFSELLGDVTTFTEHSFQGSIEKRMALVGLHDKSEYLHNIAYGAAVKANDDGRVVDAILLFRLAEDHERVLQLVNTQLGLLLSGVPLGQPVSSALSPSFDVLQIARNVMRIDGDSLTRSDSRETCMILLAIAECYDLLAKHEYQACLDRISQTGLLVLSADPAVNQVRELAQRFMGYNESIARNIPYVLLMAMTSIVELSAQLKASEMPVAGRLLDQYRGRANNCMVYAGLIQFRMPREVYSKLTQLEAHLS